MRSYLLLLVVILPLSVSARSLSCSTSSFKIPLPKEKKIAAVNNLENMTRDTLLFLLSAFTGSEPTATKEEFIEYKCASVTPEARVTFAQMSQTLTYLQAFSLMKSFLKTGAYHRAEPLRHSDFKLPATVFELEKKLRYKSWPKEIVAISQVKGLKRIIYRSPTGYPEMSIAETLTDDGKVRETEIILKRADESENYDFYAFDSKGEPAFRSPFLNSNEKETIGPVPHTCLSCHYDGTRRSFQKEPASFHP